MPPITLPHPHGSASGQIGHNAQFDTGDTPGSVGGRFIGFGENATSRIANRMAWALSENIDRIFTDILSANMVVNMRHSFVSTGQNRAQLLGLSVFCGNISYPGTASPANQEGMRMLFGVFDDQFNPIVDPSGNIVRAYSVYDAADSTLVYKTGFIISPWIHFCTANASTGAVVNPSYTIPAATTVYIIYGALANLKDMPNDHIDAFTRFSMVGAGGAGGALSGPMGSDLNMNGHDILNLHALGTVGESIIDVRGRFSHFPVSGEAALNYATYTPTGTEPPGQATLGGFVWELDTPTAGFSVLLVGSFGGPLPNPVGELSVYGTGSPTRTLQLRSSDGFFGPKAGSSDINLGGTGAEFYDGHILNLYTSGLKAPRSTLELTNILFGAVGTLTLLDRHRDIEAFCDFSDVTLAVNTASSDIKINESFSAYVGTSPGNTATAAYLAPPYLGRTTVAGFSCTTGAGHFAGIVGPGILSVGSFGLRVKTSFNLPTAPSVGSNEYRAYVGVSDTDFVSATVAAYIYVSTDGSIRMAWDDGAGNSGVINTGLLLNTGAFHTFEVILGNGVFIGMVDGAEVGNTPFTPSPSALLYGRPIEIQSFGGISLLRIDYVDVCTDGHALPR